ncbi:serine hydrolase [Roseomonas eburnea]|uniref:Serine hydrolase n=1 Tax=Neoroseomonas eburnea TaxID=1346889 RepID=A0A9X9XAH3_9PROT|nr:serine hydrolase [Neoroseomonas eburnea]MBR0680709.1 serine hydrolase [Neoroseomonas eburnea]
MRRRHLPLLLALGPAPAALAQPAIAEIDDLVRAFAALPGETAVLLRASGPRGSLQAAHRASAPIFVGSCLKTFILGAWLQEVEAGRLSLDEPLAVNDEHRSLISPVLGGLTGTAPARTVLEAMIAHSDNTATDIALHRIGAARVRALIAGMGLAGTRLPDSTRILFSTLAGAAPGTDLGWAAMGRIADGHPVGTPLAPINPHQTMVSTALDLCTWYERVLAGQVFGEASSLAEFKRISAMADAMPRIAPPDVIAYGKGGSIDWNDSQAIAVAGQMVAGPVRATFFWGANWSGPGDRMREVSDRLVASIRPALGRAASALA